MTITWNFLISFQGQESLRHHFPHPRTPACQERYDNHRRRIEEKEQENGHHYHNYVYDKLFRKGPVPFVCLPNDFPYQTESGVYHYMLWINPHLSNFRNPDRIKEILRYYKWEYAFSDYCYFSNYFTDQTVDIPHFHVFFRE